MFEIPYNKSRTTVLVGNSATVGASWIPWYKPAGAKFVEFILIGSGGGGGTGVIGANSTAAGGGGGSSGGSTRMIFPAQFLPSVIYYSGRGPGIAAVNALVAAYPTTTVNTVLVHANGGNPGGNASGATAGAAGTAPAAAASTNMPLGFLYGSPVAAGGQAGIAGGTTGAAGALTLSTSGIIVTGGTGGAGLGAAGTNGSAGGAFTVPAAPSPLNIPHPGGVAPTAATTPPGLGEHGKNFVLAELNAPYFFGGTGGASTHGTAVGAGLVQARGGDGGYGCGGGGMGGALTGSTAAVQALGGASICIITVY